MLFDYHYWNDNGTLLFCEEHRSNPFDPSTATYTDPETVCASDDPNSTEEVA